MLGTKQRKHFRMGRLYERECFGGLTAICYDQEGIVKIRRYFKEYQRREMNDFVFDLFWEYEYKGEPISARKISEIRGCDHTTIDNILRNALEKIKDGYELGIERGLLNKHFGIKKPPKEKKGVYMEPLR